LTLRSRLTAAFALVFGAMLLAYALAVYLLIRDRFAAELDHRLDQELEIAERSMVRDAGGHLAWRHIHGPEHSEDQRLRNVAWLDIWHTDGTLALRRHDAATGSGKRPSRRSMRPGRACVPGTSRRSACGSCSAVYPSKVKRC
jgi:hypothetical protein